MRAAASALVIVSVASVAVPARADDFGEISRVTHGTAYTLGAGEFAVGIVGPMQYGITDSLMLVSHPVLLLFLTPNGCLKWNMVSRPIGVSLNVSYIETFLDPKKLKFPGTVAMFPMLTVPFSSRVAFTIQGGYLLDVAPISHGVMAGGALSFLLTRSDLLAFQGQDEYYTDGRGFSTPTFLVTYTHAFYRMRLTAGVAAGRFPVQVGSASTDIKEFPVYPVIDLWWQL